MNDVDFSNYKFHCSSLPILMTGSNKKSEELGTTVMSYLDDIWLDEVLDYKEPIFSNPMEKGTIVESDALQLYCDVVGEMYFKNNEVIEDDFVIGTPDVKSPLIDIKSPYTLKTFKKKNESDAIKTYFWQLAGYAMILGVDTAKIVYSMVDTPEHLMFDEARKYSFNMSETEAEDLVRKNHVVSHLPKKIRIKEYTFNFTNDDFSAIKDRVMYAREYLNECEL